MLPIIWLIAALSGLKMAGHKACAVALLITMTLAVGFWKSDPLSAVTAVLEGTLNALWPICLVIIAALFTYNLMLRTGAMELVKKMLMGVSRDKRVLALLIGWGFGSFMEGMAGFGTAVAIPASMLVGIGLNPVSAVLGCLVVNSTPTAFGSVGVPTVTLSSVTGLETLALSGNAAVIQLILTCISPFLLVCICGNGIKALKGMIPVTIISAFSFTIPWFFTAKFIGPELPNIVGSICSMGAIIAAAKMFNMDTDSEYAVLVSGESKGEELISAREGLKAWSSFILIFLFLMLTSTLCPPIHDAIAGIKSTVTVYVGEGGNALSFSWINTPGVMIFLAGILGGLLQGAGVKDMTEILAETLKKYWKTVLTICAVMSTAKIMSYSGMISDIAGFLVAAAGPFYPLIAPLIGALGGFVTGSGTSTCVLFGGLQSETAQALGLDAMWMASANVMGAGIGKMICPQSIAIGTGAINAMGSESRILSAVFKYFLFYVAASGIICYVGVLVCS